MSDPLPDALPLILALLRLQIAQQAAGAHPREKCDELTRKSDNLRPTIELALGLMEAATEHAIIGTDVEGAIEIFSRGAESMLAYARADAIGTSIERLYDPEQVRASLAEEEIADTDEGRLQVLVGGARPGQAAVREWNYVRSNGTRVPVEVTVTRRPELKPGVEPGYLFLATDVTHRREAERLQEEIIGTISHELRTRSPRCSGTSSCSPRTRSSPTSSDAGSTRSSATPQGCCGWSTISGSASRSPPAPSASLRRSSTSPRRCGPRLEIDAPTQVVVRGDPVRLNQAFANLLSNGVKFTRRGGSVMIAVHEGTLADGASAGVVMVRDTGIGIAPEDLDRLTEWFYRSRTARDRRIRGIEVGLSIVKAISDAHRGTLDVESTLGEGTTFTLKLPLSGPPGEAG